MSYISEAHCTCFCMLSDIFTERLNYNSPAHPHPIPRIMLLGNPQKSDVLCFPDCLVSQSLFCVFLLSSLDMQSSPHNQFTFRPLPPPPPPPHACTCARKPPPAADSLQRRSMTTRSQPSPAAPAPPTSTQDSVHLHNSWVLNSNIPLETRYLSYD